MEINLPFLATCRAIYLNLNELFLFADIGCIFHSIFPKISYILFCFCFIFTYILQLHTPLLLFQTEMQLVFLISVVR